MMGAAAMASTAPYAAVSVVVAAPEVHANAIPASEVAPEVPAVPVAPQVLAAATACAPTKETAGAIAMSAMAYYPESYIRPLGPVLGKLKKHSTDSTIFLIFPAHYGISIPSP